MTYYGNVSTPSNRADWIETCKVIDTDTGDPIDLSTCIISMTVLKKVRNPNFYADGFYGAEPDAAGYMPLEQSEEIIRRCVRLWRAASNAASLQRFDRSAPLSPMAVPASRSRSTSAASWRFLV